MGRPRSEEAREAALAATVELVLEHGVEGVTFEDVAARSGVAKTTLYRHFGTKQAMVVAAAESCFVEYPTPDTGDLADDLRAIFERSRRPRTSAASPTSCRRSSPASGSGRRAPPAAPAMIEERRRPIRTVLQLAQLAGRDRPSTSTSMWRSPC